MTLTQTHCRTLFPKQLEQLQLQKLQVQQLQQLSPKGWPSCRGPGGLVASQVPTLVGDMAGEARS